MLTPRIHFLSGGVILAATGAAAVKVGFVSCSFNKDDDDDKTMVNGSNPRSKSKATRCFVSLWQPRRRYLSNREWEKGCSQNQWSGERESTKDPFLPLPKDELFLSETTQPNLRDRKTAFQANLCHSRRY